MLKGLNPLLLGLLPTAADVQIYSLQVLSFWLPPWCWNTHTLLRSLAFMGAKCCWWLACSSTIFSLYLMEGSVLNILLLFCGLTVYCFRHMMQNIPFPSWKRSRWYLFFFTVGKGCVGDPLMLQAIFSFHALLILFTQSNTFFFYIATYNCIFSI